MANHMIITKDPMANYICGEVKDEDLPNLISGKVVDYGLTAKPKEEPDPRKTLSYYQVKDIQEGIEWYRQLDPRIPEELLPVFSRFNFGDLSTLTKKQLRNENKKKKKKKIPTNLTITHGEEPYVIRF